MASVSSLAMWFTENSGEINLIWLGWEISTSFSIFLVTIFCTFFFLTVVFFYIYKIFSFPMKIKNNIQKYRVRKANIALQEGLIASINNETTKVIKNYNYSKKYLKETPLLLLLKLQSHLIKNDEAYCFNTYKKMLGFPSTRSIAIKGLITIASKNNDLELFSNMLESANTFKLPLNIFLSEAYKFSKKNNNWSILKKYIKKKSKNNKENNIISILNYNMAIDYFKSGELEKSSALVSEAIENRIYLPPVIQLYCKIKKTVPERYLKNILSQYWKNIPHPNILNCVLDNFNNLNINKKVKLLIELLEGHDNLYLKHLLLGEIKAKAKIWGDAKNDLIKSINLYPNKKAYLLLVFIEEQTFRNKDKIKEWLDLASTSNDTLWKCSSCFYTQKDWEVFCENCKSILTFDHAGSKYFTKEISRLSSNSPTLKIA